MWTSQCQIMSLTPFLSGLCILTSYEETLAFILLIEHVSESISGTEKLKKTLCRTDLVHFG